MSTIRTMDAAPSRNACSHYWMIQFFGSIWFLLLALFVAIRIGASPFAHWPSLLSSFCLASFYLLLALLILTRPPPKAQAEGLSPKVTAFAGTYLPWTITFFGKTDQALPNLASTACILIGVILMLVTIWHLGRSFSIVPQVRSVVQTGPYRCIRHPLYFSEEITILGVVLQYMTPGAIMIVIIHIGIQIRRIIYEEDLLRRNCVEYSRYETSRWRLVPYVW